MTEFYANHKPTLKGENVFLTHGIYLIGMLREQLEKKGLVPHIADSMLVYANEGMKPEDVLEDNLEHVIDRDVIVKLGDKKVQAHAAFYRKKGLNKGVIYHVQDEKSRTFAKQMCESKPSLMKIGPFCIEYSEWSKRKYTKKT